MFEEGNLWFELAAVHVERASLAPHWTPLSLTELTTQPIHHHHHRRRQTSVTHPPHLSHPREPRRPFSAALFIQEHTTQQQTHAQQTWRSRPKRLNRFVGDRLFSSIPLNIDPFARGGEEGARGRLDAGTPVLALGFGFGGGV